MMNVLFLRPQPGIRSLKYALAFKRVGFDIEIIHGYTCKTLTEFYGYGDEHFKKFVKLDLGNLERDIRRLENKYQIDFIHSQNAPDYLTVSAIRAVDDAPVIHENQDVISMRKTPFSPGAYPGADRESQLLDERIANERCNARIHVTEEICEYILGKYGSKRDLVFHNYISESMVPASSKEKVSKRDGSVHIVYEGTLASYEGDHYDLRKIFKDIADHRMHIHIYDSNPNKDYRKLAEKDGFIHYHGHLDPRELFEEITRYDYGWSGFNVAKNKPHMDVALPNKLFEYLACGLPVLSFPHKAQKRFIEKHGVGLAFKDMEELREKLADKELLERIRENVLKKRFQFTVERNVGKMIRLYQTVKSEREKQFKTLIAM